MELNVSHITKSKDKFNIFSDITFSIKSGECLGLIGPNGAGKTSIIRSLLRIYSIDYGEIALDGVSIKDKMFDQSLKQVSVVLDNLGLYRSLNARENLEFFDRLKFPKSTKKERSDRIDKVLKQFDLLEKKENKITFFSKGMKQRLALARAFINKPELLILDEPFQGLDVDGSFLLREYLLELKKDIGILISSHDLLVLFKVCDKFLFIKEGRVIKYLSKEDVIRDLRNNFYLLEKDKACLLPDVSICQVNGENVLVYSEKILKDYIRKPAFEEVDIELYYKGIMRT
ncbi:MULTISPECIES: ABC transporter ATP-binding protein [Bacillota]|uniref:ABC transporter ATP-binding protein n=1 Tax=Bacillota TaxID=1239 RepID=UPI002430DC2F|nr:ABC transporter ATP-binding protein [Anaerococcus vaginalis]HES7786121.1 ABC transporter ATP-binding protein [Streptococcus pyogenes]